MWCWAVFSRSLSAVQGVVIEYQVSFFASRGSSPPLQPGFSRTQPIPICRKGIPMRWWPGRTGGSMKLRSMHSVHFSAILALGLFRRRSERSIHTHGRTTVPPIRGPSTASQKTETQWNNEAIERVEDARRKWETVPGFNMTLDTTPADCLWGSSRRGWRWCPSIAGLRQRCPRDYSMVELGIRLDRHELHRVHPTGWLLWWNQPPVRVQPTERAVLDRSHPRSVRFPKPG